MRINQLLRENALILNQILLTSLKIMYGDQSGEFVCKSSLRADPLNLVYSVYRTISTLYAIRGPAAPQANVNLAA